MDRKVLGCSLKIHRVEISVADGKQKFVKVLLHRAVSNILIASTNVQFDRKIAIGYGITRQVKDLTDIRLSR